MLENTATPQSLKSRNRVGFNTLNTLKIHLNNEPSSKQQAASNQTFEISKGNSLHYLKELSAQKNKDYFGMNEKERQDRRTTWSPLLAQNSLNVQKRDHKSDLGDLLQYNMHNKENSSIYNKNIQNIASSSLQSNQQKAKNRVTFKDEILETEKVFQAKEANLLRQQNGVNPPSYPEKFKNFSKKLDRYQHQYQQQQYENREVFHENIEKSYIQNHSQSPEWNSDALMIAKSAVSKNQIYTKVKYITMSIAFVILIISLSCLFFNFKTIKLFKVFILISAVIILRTLTYEEQFQNGLREQRIKDLGILIAVAAIEFFCLMGFSTEIFQALLPSQIQLEIFWVVPSGFLALMETVMYWRRNQQNKINEEFLNIKCSSFDILKESIKNYFQSFQFIKESLICLIGSGLIVTCCYYSKTYYQQQFLLQDSYSKRESHILLNPFPEILLNQYYTYIIGISILARYITSFAMNFNYQLIRYSVVLYLGNYICFQPLYTIIFKYPLVFSDYIQHEAMKYWYTYQTAPLSQVIERTQYAKNLTENENKVLDTIFEFIQKEMNGILITMSSNEMEDRGQQMQQRDITSFFIKNRKIQSLLRKQRFLQQILKFTLIIISNSARVFNMKIVDFVQSTSSYLDQLIQLFEKQSNYYTAEIADIIILKKEIVSNLQYIYTKMNNTVKCQNLSALTLSIICDSAHIYNEYDTETQFVC